MLFVANAGVQGGFTLMDIADVVVTFIDAIAIHNLQTRTAENQRRRRRALVMAFNFIFKDEIDQQVAIDSAAILEENIKIGTAGSISTGAGTSISLTGVNKVLTPAIVVHSVFDGKGHGSNHGGKHGKVSGTHGKGYNGKGNGDAAKAGKGATNRYGGQKGLRPESIAADSREMRLAADQSAKKMSAVYLVGLVASFVAFVLAMLVSMYRHRTQKRIEIIGIGSRELDPATRSAQYPSTTLSPGVSAESMRIRSPRGWEKMPLKLSATKSYGGVFDNKS